MKLASVAKIAEKFVADNSPAILTGVGVTGVITTVILTGKATVKAERILRQDAFDNQGNVFFDHDIRDRARLTWRCYIPPAIATTTTVAAIVCANQIGTRRAAAVAAAYSLSEKAFAEYKDKVAEKLGVKQEQSVCDELAQDRVSANPPQEVIVVGDGDVLCYDSMTGRYFQSNMERIRSAQNSINEILLNHMYASLDDFYNMIGLSSTAFTEEVGWNVDRPLKIIFSTVIAEGGKPCLVVDYETVPIRGYNRLS